MKVLRIIAGVTLVLAIVALGLGGYGIVNFEPKASAASTSRITAAQVRTLTAEVASLKRQLKSQGSQLANAQSSIFSLQDSTTAGQVSGLKRTVAHLTTCLPQLQTEIGGLGISWQINGFDTSKDSFNITNPTIISSDCSGVLYGG